MKASLARARGIAVDSVKHAGIVESAAGKVRLLKRDELDPDWAPEEDGHLTVWECLQHLVRLHERSGLSHDSAALLKRLGPQAEAVKDLAYCLYDIAANKRREAPFKGESYPGEHDGIIDRETWDRVHAILQESPRKRAARTRAETPALLKGLLFGPDGAAFSPTHTRKGDRLYRYYVSQTVLKHGAGSCPIGRVPAGEIEAAVPESRELRAACSVSRRSPWQARGKPPAHPRRRSISRRRTPARPCQQLHPLWDENSSPAEQARIVALLIERVDIVDERPQASGLRNRRGLRGLGQCNLATPPKHEPRGCRMSQEESHRPERSARGRNRAYRDSMPATPRRGARSSTPILAGRRVFDRSGARTPEDPLYR